VSFVVDDQAAALERVLGGGLVLRDLPGTRYLRASVGGWTTDDELDRLAEIVAG
jgi:L-cysteine/cystine lyase